MKLEEYQAHNLEVAGSSPAPATNFGRLARGRSVLSPYLSELEPALSSDGVFRLVGGFFKKPQVLDYSYIVDYLCQTVGPTIQDIGERDSRVNKYYEMVIAEAFRRYICGEDGDEGNGFFKIDEIGAMYVFNGKFFECISETRILGVIRAVLRKCNVGIVYYGDSAARIAKYVQESLMQEARCQFVPDRRYVAFKNCVLDMETGQIHPHDYKYCTDIIMNFSYDRDARSALWDKVLAQTVPDEGMRSAFQQFCGAFLINRAHHKFEYICFVVGEGQNGKSIICKAIVNVFKNEDENGQRVTNCITTFTPEQLFKSAQMDYHMAEVQGKIMNYCDDVSDKDFSGGDFKAFVSGGEFTGRSPYSREMTKVTKVPIMLCCANKIPPTTDDSDGYFRRFLIINCPNKVSERDRDPQLEAKLQDDKIRAAIFNWMMEGRKMLVGNDCKIVMSKSVLDLKDDMKADSNSARRWIREFGMKPGIHDWDWKSLKEWMNIYQQYCKDYGEAAKTAKGVSKVFDDLGFRKRRTGQGTWYCIAYEIPENTSAEDLNDDEPEISVPKLPF